MQSTQRFSGKSKQYVKYRPSYPGPIMPYLASTLGWDSSVSIADIGAGTGIFTSMLLKEVSQVIAVEPNDDMRHELLEGLHHYIVSERSPDKKRLVVKAGTAEATGLQDKSVDGIVCAQSYHWFDPALARAEFMRILGPDGYVVLLWNQRDIGASSFMSAYDSLFMKYGSGYKDVKHKEMSVEALTPFYGGKAPQLQSFYNEQSLDLDGFIGRIQSSSYSPTEGDSHYESFIREANVLFMEHEEHGVVKMVYRTDLYWSTLS